MIKMKEKYLMTEWCMRLPRCSGRALRARSRGMVASTLIIVAVVVFIIIEFKNTLRSNIIGESVLRDTQLHTKCRHSINDYNIDKTGPSNSSNEHNYALSQYCAFHKHLQCDRNINSPCNRELRDNLLVDKKHKIIYCPIPKVACSTIKYRLAKANAKKQVVKLPKPIDLLHAPSFLSRYGLVSLSQFKREDQEHMMSTYFKFIFVRHPLERLVSAYKNKLIHSSQKLFNNFAKEMAIYSRGRISKFENDLTFQEFLHFILFSDQDKFLPFEPHWQPYHMLCDPCTMKYDFIGRMESFYEDTKRLDKLLMHHCNLTLSGSELRPHATNTSDTHVKNYLSNLPPKILKKLDERLNTDMSMFGYSW